MHINKAPEVKGLLIDQHTRCVHYHSSLDVIAIRLSCCKEYYACYYCHQETTSHQPALWKQYEYGVQAILCGMCNTEMTIAVYKACNYRCPYCSAPFNPGCKNHDHLYFEAEP